MKKLSPPALLLLLLALLAAPPADGVVVTNIAYLRLQQNTNTWLPNDTNTLFQVDGVVTTFTNITTTNDAEFFIQDDTAGIAVFFSGASTLRPNAGDKLRVVGPLGSFRGLLELNLIINDADYVLTLSTNNALPAATPFKDFSLTNNLPAIETLEGSLITITNVYFTNAPGSTFASGATLGITNAAGQGFSLRVDSRVGDIIGKPIPKLAYQVNGVLSQFLSETNADRHAGYQIEPTRYVDIVWPPTITLQPASQTTVAGQTVGLTVTAGGTPPLIYQWRFQGTNLPGATNATLILPSVTTNQYGSYLVTITNSAGGTNSQPATLTAPALQVRGFSLLTYNLDGFDPGNGDWSTNVPKVQAVGRQLMYLQPDIITFNEIPNTNTYQIPNFVAAFLPGYYYATNSATDGSLRSVIASRYPILGSASYLHATSLAPFGASGYTFTRDLFQAAINVPGFAQPLDVFTAHLKATTSSASTDALRRAAEAGAISNFLVTTYLLTNGSRLYTLSGDLNEDIVRPGTDYTSGHPIQALVAPSTGLQLTTPVNPINGSDLTESIRLPLDVRFDYILPCGLLFSNVLGGQVFRTDLLTNPPPPLLTTDDVTASDHLPVLMLFANPYAFRLTAMAQSNQTVSLSWNVVAGQRYSIEASSNLTAWSVVASNLTTTNSSFIWSTNATATHGFFRAALVP